MPLRVLLDEVPLAEAGARALWQRFSAWMETHEGDLAGFARAEGFSSVHPEIRGGEPVLVASRTMPQRPYARAVVEGASAARSGRKRPGRRR